NAVLVQQKHITARGRRRGSTGGAVRFNPARRHASSGGDACPGSGHIDRMAGVKLVNASNLPPSNHMSCKALLTLHEGQFVGHVELEGMPMVEASPAIGKLVLVI